MPTTTQQSVLDAAAAIVLGDGFDALSLRRLARHLDRPLADIDAHFPALESLVARLLTREAERLARVIGDHIDRDPLGGLPSRIFRYSLVAVYEQPVARALYLDAPSSLARMVHLVDGLAELPVLSVHADFLPALQRAGMMRDDVDPRTIAALLDAVGAGVAVAATRQQIDDVAAGLATLLERAADADVEDTTPGKLLFAQYAAIVAAESPRG